MDTATAINEVLSAKWPEDYFEKELPEHVTKKQLMEVYTEVCLRHSDFFGCLAHALDFYPGRINIKKGYYPYIPFHACDFCTILARLVSEYKIHSFLDVGAGIGDKVAIAKKLIKKASGIEYLKEYVKMARELGVGLLHADAFNFHRYDKYDLIYMYHPIQDKELYKKLVQIVLDRIKVGGFFLEVLPRNCYDIIANDSRFEILISYEQGNSSYDELLARKIRS